MNNADFFITQISSARRFCLDLQPDKKSPLTVISGGIEKCSPDYDNYREDFPYFCLEFVIAGSGKLKLDGKENQIFPGCVFSYGPGISHHIKCSAEEPMTKYFIDFAGKKSLSRLESIQMPPGALVRSKNPEELSDAFHNIVKYGCKEQRHVKKICELLFEALILILSDNTAPFGTAAARALSSFQKLKSLIDAKYLELHNLDDIAGTCNIEPAYMCRLFKRFEGETPYKYLIKLKMKHAASLLRGGNIMIKEVAKEVNFTDPYFFSKTFKRVYGISPEKFTRLSMY